MARNDSRLVSIYVLSDPRDGADRYVGQTTKPLRDRVACHMAPSSIREGTPRGAWLRELAGAGLRPTARLLRVTDAARADDGERAEIARLRAEGAPLVNVVGGGFGGTLGLSPSPETRERISRAQRGKPRGPMPREAVERAVAKRRGRKRSPEAIEATAAAKRGTKHTPEALAKMSAAHLARYRVPGARERLAQAHGGKPFMDQNGRRYETIQGAARDLGLSPGHICSVLKGKRKSTGGYVFRYEGKG